jgi:hypothetical protein
MKRLILSLFVLALALSLGSIASLAGDVAVFANESTGTLGVPAAEARIAGRLSVESLVEHSRAGLIAAAVYCDTPTNSYEFLPATNGEPGSVLLPWKPHYSDGGTPVTTNWWKRNPDFFLTRAGYDVSGFKVSGDWITERNITLLSPRLAVGARHNQMYAGNTAIFVSMTGIAWTGTVSAVATNFTGSEQMDVALYLLTNAAPSYIVPVPVLDASAWSNYAPWWDGGEGNTNGPAVFTRHQQKNWGGGVGSGVALPTAGFEISYTNFLPNSSSLPWGATWDSSQPVVLPVDGRLVLVCSFYYSHWGNILATYRDQIDAQAAAWGVDGPEWVADLRGIADRVTGAEVTLDATRTELQGVGGVASNAFPRAEFRRGDTANSITGSLYFASEGVGTNVIYVTGAGMTNFNGAYLWEGSKYTNSAAGASSYYLYYPGGTWAFRSSPPIDMYTGQTSSLVGPYTVASGAAPAPVVTLGTNFMRVANGVIDQSGGILVVTATTFRVVGNVEASTYTATGGTLSTNSFLIPGGGTNRVIHRGGAIISIGQ